MGGQEPFLQKPRNSSSSLLEPGLKTQNQLPLKDDQINKGKSEKDRIQIKELNSSNILRTGEDGGENCTDESAEDSDSVSNSKEGDSIENKNSESEKTLINPAKAITQNDKLQMLEAIKKVASRSLKSTGKTSKKKKSNHRSSKEEILAGITKDNYLEYIIKVCKVPPKERTQQDIEIL